VQIVLHRNARALFYVAGAVVLDRDRGRGEAASRPAARERSVVLLADDIINVGDAQTALRCRDVVTTGALAEAEHVYEGQAVELYYLQLAPGVRGEFLAELVGVVYARVVVRAILHGARSIRV